MKRREPTPEEVALFEATFKDAVRLVVPTPAASRHRASSRSNTGAPPRTPRAAASVSPSGVDGRTRARLKRGDLEPEARLDLHGLGEAAAHRALSAFLRQVSSRGMRLVLIVTGKGLKETADPAPELLDRRRGVLRQLTPRWLKEPELARYIAEVQPAHRRHGGGGALYVYLRKS
ncbi:MAG: Smr/MutS family protein [Alphaproteobacteria bacterium]|nr:Smr/MutS family protein [Alphaproteobacteria bacterium]